MATQRPATAKTRSPAAKTARPPTAKGKPATAASAPKKAAPRPPAPAPAAAVETEKATKKSGKPGIKLVRDSFTMPEADYALIAALKSRALDATRVAKKSELLRAGLHALSGLDPKGLVAALDKLEVIKTGRPRKRH